MRKRENDDPERAQRGPMSLELQVPTAEPDESSVCCAPTNPGDGLEQYNTKGPLRRVLTGRKRRASPFGDWADTVENAQTSPKFERNNPKNCFLSNHLN